MSIDKEYYIIRQDNYEDQTEQSNICLQDWLIYVNSDKELQLDYASRAKFLDDGETVMEFIPGFAYWTAHPNYNQGIRPYFTCDYGGISAKNLDGYSVLKMFEIAKLLGGRLVDTDQKLYEESDLELHLRQDFLFNRDNSIFRELTTDISVYSLFVNFKTFTIDTRDLDLELNNISATSFRFRLFLKKYENPPKLYSIGRMRRLEKGSSKFQFTVKGLEGPPGFVVTEKQDEMF